MVEKFSKTSDSADSRRWFFSERDSEESTEGKHIDIEALHREAAESTNQP
jgi:hypothetical protein